MKSIVYIIAAIVFISGCQKEIDLKLDDKSGDIVIEGNVTDQAGPYYVKITRSVPFTENNTYPAVANATVIISDNTGQVDTLQYESDGRYRTTSLTTSPGNTYTLTVIVGDVVYTASSTLPQPVSLDSLREDSLSFAGTVVYTVIPVYTDPAATGNRYHFRSSVNGIQDASYNLFSDEFYNGVENVRPLSLSGNDDDGLKKDDVVEVTLECVDANIYTYYSALSDISGGFGGGSTPANPPTNLSGNALGYFSAHTVSTQQITIE